MTASRRVACGVLLATFVGLGPVSSEEGFKVIANPRVAGHTVSKSTLSQIYLGRVKRWGNGQELAAVDLPSASPVRAAFTQTVLGMTVLGVRSHWLRVISVGGRPPLTRPDDAAVVSFVAAEAGAIGYVSEAAVLPETVKLLTIE